LERLRQLIVKLIRENQLREGQLSDMDLKIALLVRNRISIDDVIKTTKSYSRKQKKKEGEATEADPETEWLSLKSLQNKSRTRLEGYSHLFYLLQTQPKYLAKLLYEMKASNKVQNFIQTVVLTLFGYAQNPREEYLLLKLFKVCSCHLIQCCSWF
jgi:Ras GTPase-activating-like protein IQGAP2/3